MTFLWLFNKYVALMMSVLVSADIHLSDRDCFTLNDVNEYVQAISVRMRLMVSSVENRVEVFSGEESI